LRPRPFILFLAIVLVPLGIAAWLGLKVARDDEILRRHQLESLLRSRLGDVDKTIAGVIGEVEQQLLGEVLTAEHAGLSEHAAPVQASRAMQPAAALHPETAGVLRGLRRKQPLVRELFVIEPGGRLVLPPRGDAASAQERAFRERTQVIWRGDAVLYEPPGAGREAAGEDDRPGRAIVATKERGPTPQQAPRPRQGDTLLALAAEHSHGWIAWYWEEGLHLLLWRRLPGGGVMGAEVERVALLARIVAALPATEVDDGRVVLADSRGQPMHQWGPYEAAAGQAPVATAQVSYPLHSWRLMHLASPAQRQALFGHATRMSLFFGALAVALAIVAMAAYFYRDTTHRLRDAAERVSFVTRVSHELKTPLTNIRLYAELLQNDLDEDDPRQRRAGVIIAESRRLTRLIDNILVFSKTRRGRLRPQSRLVAVDEAVAAVLAQFAPALAAKAIAPSFAPGAPRPVRGDPDGLGQIIANLVSNVEKYAAEGGVLDITTSQDARRTVVRVADRGPGIPKSHRELIFRPFYRVSDKLSDGVTGTGIGLAIARDLARALGGDLTLAVRDPEAAGACFELWLPTVSDTEAPATPPEAETPEVRA
jgi:signal transduction histidine kinase